MPETTDQQFEDPEQALLREVVLMARAERRLREHELTRRRILLALAVVLSVAGVVLASAGHPTAGAAVLGGGFFSAAGTFVRPQQPKD